MFKSTIRLGSVRGIKIGLNWTWIVIFGLVSWSLGDVVFPASNPGLGTATYVAMAVVATLLFFTSLVLHELGHAIRAQKEGMRIEGITLWLFGGVAQFRGSFPSAGAEFRIAIAGPLVTLAIVAVTLGAAVAAPLPGAVDGVVSWLGFINVILFAFNMLPGFPLDGGRVLRSSLWHFKKDFAWATRIASTTGRFFGGAMMGGGIASFFIIGYSGGIWLALIGWFLANAARGELALLSLREGLADMTVANLMMRDPETVPANMSVQEFVGRVHARRGLGAYPVLVGEYVLGALTPGSVENVLPEERARKKVGGYITPLDEVLRADEADDLGKTIIEMLQSGSRYALVMNGDELRGMLFLADVLPLAAAAAASERR